MNYQKHYEKIINRGKSRTLEGYKERHHIIPRCMGGSDEVENLVDLTPEEHFVCHQLLVKIFPNNSKLICAAWMMSHNPNGKRRRNKTYGWLKRLNSERDISEETRKKLSEAGKGKTRSDETRMKISIARIGYKVSEETREKQRNKKLSEETKQKISEAHLGRPSHRKGKVLTEDQKQKMRKPKSTTEKMKKPKSEEHKQKLREAFSDPKIREELSLRNKGKPVSEERKMKQSIAMRGRSSHRKGIPMSEESKRKLSETQKARLAKNATNLV